MVARRAASSRPAFALVDVIVATIILGAALAVMIGLSARSIGAQAKGEELAAAAHLADEQLQLVLSRGPDNYARRFPVEGVCDPLSDASKDKFRYRLDFSGGGSTGETYRVAATISWTSGSTPTSLTIETLMAPREVDVDGNPDPDRKPQSPVVRIQ